MLTRPQAERNWCREQMGLFVRQQLDGWLASADARMLGADPRTRLGRNLSHYWTTMIERPALAYQPVSAMDAMQLMLFEWAYIDEDEPAATAGQRVPRHLAPERTAARHVVEDLAFALEQAHHLG